MVPQELADAIRNEIRRVIREEFTGSNSPFVTATYTAAEAVDGNLSKIDIDGEECRFVPKANITLTAGDNLLCVRTKNIPLTIIAVLKGDISLAT